MDQKCKELILSSGEPLIFRNYVNWGLVKWKLDDWSNLLKNEELVFRCGKKAFTQEPQWERATRIKKTTFKEFISFTESDNNSWMYFDYKYLKDWFKNTKELKKEVNWSLFGFPELSSEDSTIWIGSAGAHTPCHIDTYGCNIVVQIHGRKQWILFPPDENLKPTRIPYEESSIYSKLNFFSPMITDFDGVGNCRRVVLEPGDALFVPHKWWHYVENLDTAISINVWLPLPEDHEERFREALVQFFITQVTQNLDLETKKAILNPNSDQEIGDVTLDASLDIVNKCKDILTRTSIQKRPIFDENKCLPFVEKIPVLSPQEFANFLQDQKSRFRETESEAEKRNFGGITNLIEAFSHPDTISLVAKKFLESSRL
ncbi:HSPB1-associated protein 1 isoform X2 [Tribolium castaneum]|uniref:HSPB1-associated protein 1 isoform X2 n=1 Tax=Tribolium castaneum TaxID=7070 RepID=UPI0000D567FA|nr:PREDICTED: HSPB1-associated protein 1 isoform X2 [Tribolium castaneum]|eukprot:XP_971977.1 PREDICTED: HSPB1-associated protein 1 isoform X2 [Tribolium castaneum]